MRKKYKIAIVTECLAKGGLQKVAAMQSQGLSNRGHEVHVISMHDDIVYTFGGQLLNLGSYKNSSCSWLNKLHRFCLFFYYIHKHNIDVIIDHRCRQQPIIEAFINLLCYRGRQTYLNIHNSNVYGYLPKNDTVLRMIHNRASSTICVSEGVRKILLSKYSDIKTNVILNPYNEDEIGEMSLSSLGKDYGKYILAVGRMETDQKGFDLLLQAFAKTKAKDSIKLMILGDGPLKKEYQNLAVDLKIEDRVLFTPFDPNPYKYMKNAYCLILSSRLEGFGLVITESLACGTPVIAFDCPSGPAELIRNEINGLLIPCLNIPLLSKAIDRMFFEKTFYETCKNNAKNSIKHLSLEKHCVALEKLFDEH